MNKLINNYKLYTIRKKYKYKKIVLCHGVFDIIHYGHINHFIKAKSYGDILVVTLTNDSFVKKGTNRPFFNISNRLKVIKNLSFVDFVSISDDETAVEIIKNLKPDFYCKGIEYKNNDYTNNIKKEIAELKKNKGKIIFTDEQSSSSSKIINNLFSVLPEENKKLINKIKSKHNIKTIEKEFYEIKNKKILVIGEIIIDKLSNCKVIGKSSKDLHLIVKEENSKVYLGGVASIANYISEFCQVTVLSIVGKDYNNYNLIKNLKKNIKKQIYIENKGQTILKKRYIDIDSDTKLFGKYNADNCIISKKNETKIISFLKDKSKNFDKIILCDYGHNFINKKILEKISKINNKIILNSQINAHNLGFHNYQKYKKINFLVANEKEIRHDLQDPFSRIDTLIDKFLKKYNFKNLVVTRGSNGLIYCNYNKKINYPAFGFEIKDRVGAGDTLLSFIGIFFNDKKKDNDLCFFLASIAAAENLKNYMNSSPINKNILLKKIMHLIS
jgi:rfaE bifunctional protein kinase chain/domain/rfaE bifunctional protein nucleotidyltransferase chain/domain